MGQNSNKKIMLSIIGTANTIRVGRVSFVTEQTDTINLTNLFPIDPEETGIINDSTKVGTLEITIEGDTDYSDGIEYLISTTNASIHTNQGRTIPISNVSASTGIDFSKMSGDTNNDNVIDNGEGLYIRAGTENDAYPVVYYRGDVDNNVYFAGKCWQMVRTTDTGGTKMIYNGENTGNESSPSCEPSTGTDRQITLNISGSDVNTFSFSGTGLYNSLAYTGYTYTSPVYQLTNGNYASGSKFGNGITWDGTNYTITDVSNAIDVYHHYTCGTANTITCSTIRYYYSYFTNNYMYFTLTNGKTIEDVLSESIGNGTTDSNAKQVVEDWYEQYIDITDDAQKIEDTIYCSDRTINDLGGFNPNGGSLSSFISFSLYNRVFMNPSVRIKCLRPQDAFTKSSTKGNGLLDYPVGLITIDEIILAGGALGISDINSYFKTGEYFVTMSPIGMFSSGSEAVGVVSNSGNIFFTNADAIFGIRPVISIKPDSSIASGTGTAQDPYIIK